MGRQITWTIFAFLLAPLAPSVLYTLLSFGSAAFVPFFYFVVVVAYLLTLTLCVPFYLVLLWKDRVRLLPLILTAFVVYFLFYGFLGLISFSGMNELTSRGSNLVSEGRVTFSGYLVVLSDAVVLGALASIGGFLFWLVQRVGHVNRA